MIVTSMIAELAYKRCPEFSKRIWDWENRFYYRFGSWWRNRHASLEFRFGESPFARSYRLMQEEAARNGQQTVDDIPTPKRGDGAIENLWKKEDGSVDGKALGDVLERMSKIMTDDKEVGKKGEIAGL